MYDCTNQEIYIFNQHRAVCFIAYVKVKVKQSRYRPRDFMTTAQDRGPTKDSACDLQKLNTLTATTVTVTRYYK
jgi:hypothetical protein